MEKTSKKIIMIRYGLLFIAALIWGLAFAVQCDAMDSVKPFTFTAIRSFLGATILLPVIFISDGIKKKKTSVPKMTKNEIKTLLIGGICCGICVCVGANLQQLGIAYTLNAGKSGFITALYIVLVPVIGLFFKKKSHWIIWVSVVLAVVGLYFICMKPGEKFTLEIGDLFLIGCAFAFTAHILVIDHFTEKTDAVKMSCIQFYFSAFFSAIFALIFEREAFDLTAVLSAYPALLYTGFGSCGVAFTLQIVGQKGTNPTVSSLIMSLESCFSILGGILILHTIPSWNEGIGCTIMLCAIVLSQLKDVFLKKKNKA